MEKPYYSDGSFIKISTVSCF